MSEIKEVWHPYEPGFEYPTPVLQVTEEMNYQGYEGVMGSMNYLADKRLHGTAYTVQGTAGSSNEEAVLLYLAYANGLAPHNRIKGEFIRRVLDHAGISDSQGKSLPVVTIASPSFGSTLRGLNHFDMAEIRKGNFVPAVKKSLEIVRKAGYGRIIPVGHSYGGNLTMAAAMSAYRENLDLIAAAPSDMPSTRGFKRRELFNTFKADSEHLVTEVVNARLEPYTEALGYHKKPGQLQQQRQNAKFVLDVVAHLPINLQIFNGLTKFTIEDTLRSVINASTRTPVVLGHGNEDKIMTDGESLGSIVRSATENVAPTPDLTVIEINNGRHTWSDNVPLYGTFVLHAMQKAKVT